MDPPAFRKKHEAKDKKHIRIKFQLTQTPQTP